MIVIYDMCALYLELFICHITCAMLICFCFHVFTPMQMSFSYCTHAYYISFEYIMMAWIK
jgi:hypothetical protein